MSVLESEIIKSGRGIGKSEGRKTWSTTSRIEEEEDQHNRLNSAKNN